MLPLYLIRMLSALLFRISSGSDKSSKIEARSLAEKAERKRADKFRGEVDEKNGRETRERWELYLFKNVFFYVFLGKGSQLNKRNKYKVALRGWRVQVEKLHSKTFVTNSFLCSELLIKPKVQRNKHKLNVKIWLWIKLCEADKTVTKVLLELLIERIIEFKGFEQKMICDFETLRVSFKSKHSVGRINRI